MMMMGNSTVRLESQCICFVVISRSSRVLEFPIIIIYYLFIILTITMKYSVLKLVHA